MRIKPENAQDVYVCVASYFRASFDLKLKNAVPNALQNIVSARILKAHTNL